MGRGSHREEWDELHSSNTLPKDDEARSRIQRDGSGIWKVLAFGRMFVVINFILQLPPAVLGQLNSNPKPLYSFILMLLSYASLLLWIIELVYRWKRETVTWRMWRGRQPLLYFPSPTNSKPFFSLEDIVGLLSTILQSVFTTVNYARLVQHTNTQIQISGWPIILAFVLLCSTFWGDRTQTDQPDHVPLQSIIIDIPTSEYQESFTSLQDHFKATCWKYVLCSKITIEQVFAIVNFILELPSVVLDQLCSESKPLYALILMLLSFASLLLCIIELLHKGKTERVTWSWKRNGEVPWLYPNNPFFSFWDKVGLICAVVQPILSTVNYALVLQRRGQIQISVLPIVLTLALSCSKIWESPNVTESEGNIDEEEQVVLINQRQGVTEVSPKKESEPTASEEGKNDLTNQTQIRVSEEVFPKPEKIVVYETKHFLETMDFLSFAISDWELTLKLREARNETKSTKWMKFWRLTTMQSLNELITAGKDLEKLKKAKSSPDELQRAEKCFDEHIKIRNTMLENLRRVWVVIVLAKMGFHDILHVVEKYFGQPDTVRIAMLTALLNELALKLTKANSPDEIEGVEKCFDELIKIRNAMLEDLWDELAGQLTKANSPEECQSVVKYYDNIEKIIPEKSLSGIKNTPEIGKTWAVEKTKESLWRKEKELMQEPTRRKTDSALRRRVKSRR